MRRRTLIISAVLAACALGSATMLSTADTQVALVSIGKGGSGQDQWNGACAAAAGVSHGFGEITYAVHADGLGHSTKLGVVAAGSTVVCVIKDKVNGTVYGQIRKSLPGPAAAAVGIVKVPIPAHPEACVSGDSVFSDAGTASGVTC